MLTKSFLVLIDKSDNNAEIWLRAINALREQLEAKHPLNEIKIDCVEDFENFTEAYEKLEDSLIDLRSEIDFAKRRDREIGELSRKLNRQTIDALHMANSAVLAQY